MSKFAITLPGAAAAIGLRSFNGAEAARAAVGQRVHYVVAAAWALAFFPAQLIVMRMRRLIGHDASLSGAEASACDIKRTASAFVQCRRG